MKKECIIYDDPEPIDPEQEEVEEDGHPETPPKK